MTVVAVAGVGTATPAHRVTQAEAKAAAAAMFDGTIDDLDAVVEDAS